jgi:CHAT domain-containing protein
MKLERMSRAAAGVLAGLALALGAGVGAVDAKGFTGFNNDFNLGFSTTGVCKGDRNFDDPLTGNSVHAWDVTCRGWSSKLGRIYLFGGASPDALPAAWRAALAKRATCDFAAAKPATGLAGSRNVPCKLVGTNLDYVVLISPSRRGLILAEGRAPVADALGTAIKFMSGAIEEPAATAQEKEGIGSAAGLNTLDTTGVAASTSVDAAREEAYRQNQAWRFSDSAGLFADIGASSGNDASIRAEALFNTALNASNQGRFTVANDYFAQGEKIARDAGIADAMRGAELNYKAADARNRGGLQIDPTEADKYYRQAADLAEQAIAARVPTKSSQESAKDSVIQIADTGAAAGFATVRLSEAQKNQLRDAQALEIEATSLEIVAHDDQPQLEKAHAILLRAVALLDQPVFPNDTSAAPVTLGQASLWLNAVVRADLLRLDLRAGHPEASMPQVEAAIKAYRQKYPDHLQLAGLLVEYARAEHALAVNDKTTAMDDKALSDYEDAFTIFRNQRGSLGDSADLVGTYFDILLQRIGNAPAQHPQEVNRFFTAAQTLVEQSSADAAKREAERIKASDSPAASLERSLEDTRRRIEVAKADIMDLRQRNLYQGEVKTKADATLSDLQAQARSLEDQLYQANPKYAATLRNLVNLDELQKKLKDGEVYLKTFLLANRGYGLAVTRTSARPYAVELTKAKAIAMIDELRQPMDNNDADAPVKRFNVALAHDAFVKLFGPVQSDILGARLVVYEPDAILISVPLQAYVTDDASTKTIEANLQTARAQKKPLSYAGVAWLGARVPSSVSLSPSAFVAIRDADLSRGADPFYGFANPQIVQTPRMFSRVKASIKGAANQYCDYVRAEMFKQLQPLPQTEDEVRGVARSLHQESSLSVGASFTDAAIQKEGGGEGLRRYRVLYFATHGLPLVEGCLKPALVTSLDPQTGDGLLDVEQIPDLKLDADIVVLSACNTARNKQGSTDVADGAEAVGGLVTTFVEAGARNVVVSNWEVDSGATADLMTTMFDQTDSSQAEALAKAEQKMMARPDEYSHPYYWAPFTIVGDGARSMPKPPSTPAQTTPAA